MDNRRLDTLSAIFGMGWKRILLASGDEAWSTPTQELVFAWSPTSNDADLGMLLGKALDDKRVSLFEIYADNPLRNGYLVNVDNERETLQYWEHHASSWRVAVVKTLLVACGGELPDEKEG